MASEEIIGYVNADHDKFLIYEAIKPWTEGLPPEMYLRKHFTNQLAKQLESAYQYLEEHGDMQNYIDWCNRPRDYDLDDPNLQFEEVK